MDSFLNSDITWFWLAAGLYLAGFVLGIVSLARHRRHSRLVMTILLAVGFLAQTLALSLRGKITHGCPLTNIFEMVEFIAWSLTLLYLVVGSAFRLSLLGFFTAALAAILSTFALLEPKWDSVRTGPHIFGPNPWIEFHAALAVFSYGVFGLLALTAALQLLQTHSLKQRRFNGIFSFLPSLIALEQINFRLLATGVVLLSASLVVGSMWWIRFPQTVDSSKLAWTCLVWAAYLCAFIFRTRGHLLSQKLSWVCIALFAVAMFSVGPVNASRHPVSNVQANR